MVRGSDVNKRNFIYRWRRLRAGRYDGRIYPGIRADEANVMIGPYELNQVIVGHCLEVLKGIPDGVFHATITSPPYWALRNYQTEPVYWPSVTFAPMPGLPSITIPEQEIELGQESDPWAYTGHLVAVFRGVYRVLRDDGVLWLNLGDTYAGSWGAMSYPGDSIAARRFGGNNQANIGRPVSSRLSAGLKAKDLAGIPWRVAYALQADGWYLRSDCPWLKANAMPESIQDRPAKGTENIFLLSKRERYYFDPEAVKKQSKNAGEVVSLGEKSFSRGQAKGAGVKASGNGLADSYEVPPTRNRRNTDWFYESLDEAIAHLIAIRDSGGMLLSEDGPEAFLINPAAYKAAHFATFPTKLIEPMILASTSEYGVCGECGAQWVRVIEKVGKSKPVEERNGRTAHNGTPPQQSGWFWEGSTTKATGEWQPTCNCDAEVVPAVVLDPFMGSGTTAKVALGNRRNFIGIDANPTYATELVPERLNGTQIKLLEA